MTHTATEPEILEEITSAEIEVPDTPEGLADTEAAETVADALVEEPAKAESYTQRPMIPVALLAAHPDNVREDKQPSEAFRRSVAEVGILIPLEIAVEPDGRYRVIDGEIRLNTALELGLKEVPYTFSKEASDNEGLQYMHMVITAKHRQGLSSQEVAAGLFKATEHGMTRTAIRKATGMSAEEVRNGVRAGGLSETAKKVAAEMDYEWTLEELALLRPFEDDPEALEVIRRAAANRYGSPLKYTIQRLLDDRAARELKAKMLAELETAGIPVTEEKPDDAVVLHDLLHGEQEMDVEAHGACPGRGAWIGTWANAQPNHYCLDPVQYGHVFASTGTTSPPEPATPKPTTAEAIAQAEAEKEEAKRARRLVVEGNKAWVAAATVRREWLQEFFARKTPPRNVAELISRFVTEQIVTMPAPLCDVLGGARHTQQFAKLGGPKAKTVAASTQPGLWMLALAPIVTAYEHQLAGYSGRPNDGCGGRTNTWREGNSKSPCARRDAAAYLKFIIELGAKHGFEPSMIERSVAENFTYRGDNPEPEETETEETEASDRSEEVEQLVDDADMADVADIPSDDAGAEAGESAGSGETEASGGPEESLDTEAEPDTEACDGIPDLADIEGANRSEAPDELARADAA